MAPLPGCRRWGNVFLSRPTFNYRRDTVDREVGFLGHEQAGIFAVLIVVDVDRDIGREFLDLVIVRRTGRRPSPNRPLGRFARVRGPPS